MKKLASLKLYLAGFLALRVVLLAETTLTDAYSDLSQHYELVRVALLADSVSGVAEAAQALADSAADFRQGLSQDMQDTVTENREKLETALDGIEKSALVLASASGLEAARDELFVLTRPMAIVRKLSGDSSTVVAYCSMAQKAWIQPEGEIGNPYMGRKMPRCGDVVGE
jgi:cystathionine beta-lyase/cystathionine gamma-synthase